MSNLLEKIKRDIRSVWEQLKAKQQEINWKRVVVRNIPYGAFSYVCNKLAWLYHQSQQEVVLQKVLEMINQIEQAFVFPLPSITPEDVFIGVVGGITLKLIVIYKINHAKKFRPGREYGSARWGTAQDMKPYTDSVFEQNIILTATEYLTIQAYLIHPKFARNKNILVIGGSGSGKTRFFVKPNLMQMHSSYVVTDPKGTILIECGTMLVKNGYKIKVLNTINFKKSMHYNPFAYIRKEEDILKLVNTIIANTKGEGQQSGEDFWVNAEKLYYTALIGYI